ncbi:MAG: hypothetical protein RBT63_01810 [Bdellovibrionales bacterium]|nr:hypothetical protein [Bdellovibrionales bacterium]
MKLLFALLQIFSLLVLCVKSHAQSPDNAAVDSGAPAGTQVVVYGEPSSIEGKGIIRQVFLDRNLVAAELVSPLVEPVSEFVVSFADKGQCALKQLDRQKQIVILDISQCARKNEIRLGMLIECSCRLIK